MSRQKILRRKITVTIPYSNISEGYDAQRSLSGPENSAWQALIEHPRVEVDLGEIEETTRETPKPAPKEAERLVPRAAE